MVNFTFWRTRRESEERIFQTPPTDHEESGASETFHTPTGPVDLELTDEIPDEAPRELSDSNEGVEKMRVADVNQCIEEIGFGNYQWKVVVVMGLVTFGDACMIWLSAIIISMFKCYQ